MQVTFGFLLIVGLLFASGVFSVLLYAKFTGQAWFSESTIAYAETAGAKQQIIMTATPPPVAAPLAPSAMINAPAIRQYPELPSGCEITSLTMMFQYYGIDKGKMELLPELKRDRTPLKWNVDGSIAYWGNPNTGFVGEITGSAKGFGIFHGALFELQKKYIPTAVDLTNQPFEKLEQQLREGIPSVVWTTINYQVPDKWVVWDTPIGPLKTTFMEHAVLLVGFDESNVYVNDPVSGKSNVRIDKARFLDTWNVMGKQALSYTKS
ncbi:hypothetical protein G9U52_01495 [Paenibacillus sp. S3N08]|uniref:Peptidase C39-like domain-containing protein n=2 Tax=Paenibacillus agricola TaxID=2716264 RepID=A0ABX0IXE1_9BACL|nr:hypothetical protein [Paenibacillus agricola]